MKRIRSLAVVLALLPALLISQSFSCSGSTYHKLVAAEHSFTNTVKALQDVEIAEYRTGTIDPVLHQQIERGILEVATGGSEITKLIQENAPPETIKARVDQLYQTIDNLNSQGILRVKNQKSQAALEVALDSIRSILDNILIVLTK